MCSRWRMPREYVSTRCALAPVQPDELEQLVDPRRFSRTGTR